MRLSFVLLTYERQDLLARCLESLGPSEEGAWDVWVAFNGPDPEGEAALRRRHPWVRTLSMERVSRGEARNRAVKSTAGSVVYFLDDDTRVPPDFAARVLAKFERFPRAFAIGGPNLLPPGSGPTQRAVDFLLRSPLGAGPMRVRWIAGGEDRFVPGWALTLCNLGVRREVFETHGLHFPVDCASAEENLLLFGIERKLGPVLLCPELFLYHERRAGLASFCRQVFQSGRGRVQIARAQPRSLHAVVFAPLGLVAALVAAFIARSSWDLLPLSIYAAACLFESARMAATEGDLAGALRLVWLLPAGHLSYAAGLLSGIVAP